MQNSYLDHPTEDELERFLLNRSQDEELEVVETHVLACESCVARLEALEIEIAAMKLAVERLQLEAKHKEVAKAAFWKNWLTLPKLSFAGAAAVLVLGIALVPQFVHRNPSPAVEVDLSAYRGVEIPVVPLNRPLRLRLNDRGIPDGPVRGQIVNGEGSEVWKGTVEVRKDVADIQVLGIKQTGAYFLRLYSSNQANTDRDLLREFAFRAR